jgi:hypothetical protein
LSQTDSGADEEILNGEQRTQEGDTRIQVHVNIFQELPRRFFVTPMMRSRKDLIYMKDTPQALSKIAQGLDVVIYFIDISFIVIEIDIRQDKCSLWFQDLLYFGEFFSLVTPNVLKDSLS